MKLRYILWAYDDVFDYLAAEKIVRVAGNALAGSSDRVVSCRYIPTIRGLIEGPWQTEQEGHGPLIIAASVFLVWQSRERLKAAPVVPAPAAGWSLLFFGLVLMFLARTQGVLAVETLSVLPVIAGCILISAGWPIFRILAFPVGFLIFAVPAPDWIIDAATIPLKVLISDLVTRVLYAAGYPVAQNGVMIMIGSYQLLVKDACSGLNSIFALSAIGVFYAYAFRWDQKIRSLVFWRQLFPSPSRRTSSVSSRLF